VANIVYDGNDLSTFGLVTPGVSGAHDLPGVELQETYVPGSDAPDVQVVRRSTRKLTFHCIVVSETSHDDLVDKLEALKALLSPSKGYCTLTITDRPDQQISAVSLGFPVNIDSIPYLSRWVEFDLAFQAAVPWWEDDTEQTATIASGDATGSLDNLGSGHCWPIYTCTVGGSPLAGGLTFTIEGKTYTYEGALAAADVLVIDTEACTTTKNGSADMAGTADDCEYPELVTGTNHITAKTTGFELAIGYRRRWD